MLKKAPDTRSWLKVGCKVRSATTGSSEAGEENIVRR
jgi:hypothetical protein